MSGAELTQPPVNPPMATDAGLLQALRAGDEAVFVTLVERYYPSMLRVAQLYVPSRAVAEEVVQETWLAVLQGLQAFEGRAAFRTWLFRILTNRAKTRGTRERQSIPFSALAEVELPGEPAVEPERFRSPAERFPGHWRSFPHAWERLPEERLLDQEACSCIQRAVGALPPAQRAVLTLRDIEGWEASEVCALLQLSDANQRVLLHRARAQVRHALEQYFSTAEDEQHDR